MPVTLTFVVSFWMIIPGLFSLGCIIQIRDYFKYEDTDSAYGMLFILVLGNTLLLATRFLP